MNNELRNFNHLEDCNDKLQLIDNFTLVHFQNPRCKSIKRMREILLEIQIIKNITKIVDMHLITISLKQLSFTIDQVLEVTKIHATIH